MYMNMDFFRFANMGADNTTFKNLFLIGSANIFYLGSLCNIVTAGTAR